MNKAIGLLETKGLLGAIAAADEMVKTSNVEIIDRTISTGAMVTITIRGDVSSIHSAIEAGKYIVQKNGELISERVIPHPDNQTTNLFNKKKMTNNKKKSSPKKEAESKSSKGVEK